MTLTRLPALQTTNPLTANGDQGAADVAGPETQREQDTPYHRQVVDTARRVAHRLDGNTRMPARLATELLWPYVTLSALVGRDQCACACHVKDEIAYTLAKADELSSCGGMW